jgi:hypothetical protein
MTTTPHKLATIANNHGVVGLGPYTTAALRRAAVLTSADVGKIAQQTDTDPSTYWIVLKVASGVGTWSRVDTGAEVTAFGGDFAALAATFSLTVRGFWRGDLGVTGTQGTGKAAWANQSGSSSGMTGAADGIGSVGTGLNGKASVATNGTSQYGSYTMPAQAAPLTLPQHKWSIVKFTGTAVSKLICADTSSAIAVGGTSETAPDRNLFMFDGASGPSSTGVVRNQWYRARFSFMGNATSAMRVGAHTQSGDCGNQAPNPPRSWMCGTGGINLFEAETLCLLELEGTLANFLSFDAAAGPAAQTFWTSAIEI